MSARLSQTALFFPFELDSPASRDIAAAVETTGLYVYLYDPDFHVFFCRECVSAEDRHLRGPKPTGAFVYNRQTAPAERIANDLRNHASWHLELERRRTEGRGTPPRV